MPNQTSKPSTDERKAADKAATDTRNDGTHATAATSLGESNEARRDAGVGTPDALTTPLHIAAGGATDTYPTGNPALANATFFENAAHRAALGVKDAFEHVWHPDFLASHRAGVTPADEAAAVRAPNADELAEADRAAKATAEDRARRIAEAADALKAAADR